MRRTRAWLTAALSAVVLGLAGCGNLPPQAPHEPTHALASNTGLPLAALVDASRPKDDKRPSLSGFRLLGSSEAAYGSRMALIDAATKTLDLQYYTIHYDSSTEALMERLREAARRGVRVRLLLDDFNAVGKNVAVLRLDLEPGIEVRMFNPVSGPRSSQAGRILGSLFDFKRIQQRMHNKILVADNTLAVAGGRNLGDAYFGQSDTSNFLDLDLLVAGPMVTDLSHSFDAYWNDIRAYPVRNVLSGNDLKAFYADPAPAPPAASSAGTQTRVASAPVDAADTTPAAPAVVEGHPVPGATAMAREIQSGTLALAWAPSALLVDKPTKIAPENPLDESDRDDNVVDGVLNIVTRAQKEVLIISPYFVPGPRMMEVFTTLRQRGVRVRVLTNSLASNDAPLAHVGYARYRQPLLEAGVELFEMRAEGKTQQRFFGSTPDSRASLHTKALVIDSRLLVVGSMNLDLRSQLQNTELGMVIRSRKLSAAMEAAIDQSLDDSYELSLQDGQLRWTTPSETPGQPGEVLSSEPDARMGLKILLKLAGPFAPEEML
ncbi:MAG: phospholipase D family protein [Burkholderiaceae bacterium]|nr:phospholipase D family protein [Burkholderiaceae bacterium]